MKRVSRWLGWVGGVTLAGTLLAFQMPFRQYPGIEYITFPLPSDAYVAGDFAFARLMYPELLARGTPRNTAWKHGRSMWTQDYPRADRYFLRAVRRLTRIDARSVEQPVDLDDGDDVYNWPWLYAVQPGSWELTDSQASKLRNYLLRGGFIMLDDFWGDSDWEIFENSMKKILPGREIVEIPDSDAIFHTVYDLDDRYQVPGELYLKTGSTEKCFDCPPAWLATYDDRGRVSAAMTFDSDIGDSWEWADNPSYDEKFSALGIRTGLNYIVYAMTH